MCRLFVYLVFIIIVARETAVANAGKVIRCGVVGAFRETV